MIKAFIVRPFGDRKVLKKNASGDPEYVMYNFDRIETELIKPALEYHSIVGGTTGEVFESGDIREDMFSDLLLADIVIADLTIHNANVFYELGIRHALRDKRTILIRQPGFDDTPFDIVGYRYITYNKDNPAESLVELQTAIEETMQADRKDSPVFNVLPKLESQDAERYLTVPKAFVDEVQVAHGSGSAGKLVLLSFEASSFPWFLPALRHIAEMLFRMKVLGAAREVWERIKTLKPDDLQANDRLATIYQRMGEAEMHNDKAEGMSFLVMSDQAIERLLENKDLTDSQRAETFALKGRNAKSRWIDSWKGLDDTKKFKTALLSVHLEAALANYQRGFYEDLNHFYSGINTLGLLVCIVALIENNKELWELQFDTADEAEDKLQEYQRLLAKVSDAVQMAIDAQREKLAAKGDTDIWLSVTDADHTCLTSSNPLKVAAKYEKLLGNAGNMSFDAVIRQLKVLEGLNVRPENVKAALSVLEQGQQASPGQEHYLLFTGHMIDKEGREKKRFPPEKEQAAREQIKKAVEAEIAQIGPNVTIKGVAGGACGGDMLFHEVCMELGIQTKMYLALPEEQFKAASVAFAGAGWVDRFHKLYRELPHSTLCDTEKLPSWLQGKKGYSIWVRNNLWLLNIALKTGGMHMSLIALWDGKGGDGPGGTEHMVKEARQRGAKVIIIDVGQL
jgi:tetratricopeptide (TPR) repeat protein